MSLTIREATLDDIDPLMAWRMTVLREVFSVPDHEPLDKLEQEKPQVLSDGNQNGDAHRLLYLVTMIKLLAAAACACIGTALARQSHRAMRLFDEHLHGACSAGGGRTKDSSMAC